MFCTNCGTQLGEGALFCPECGARVGGAAAAKAPEQAAPVNPFAPPPAPEPFAPQANDAQQTWQAYAPQANDTQQAWQAYAPQANDAQQTWQANVPQADDAPQAWQTNAPQNNWQQPAVQQAYEAAPVQAKKKRGKFLAIGLGCFLLAVLVVGAIWFLNRKGERDNPVEKLTKPADNSYAALCDYVEELPNLNKLLQNAKALGDSDNLKAGLSFNLENTGFADGVRMDLELQQNKSKKRTRIQATIAVEGIEIPLRLYMDPEQLQLALPGILKEDEVLSLPLEDLPAKWNDSPLGKMTGLEMPENLDLSSLAAFDPIGGLEQYYGEDWTRFYDSVEVVPYEGSSHFDRGETLTLHWDKAALQTLLDKAESDVDGTVGLNGQDDLSGLGANMVVSVLGELEESLQDFQFCKENNMLIGFYAKIDEGSVELRLLGTDNPWEHITVDTEEDGDREGVDIRLVKGGGQLRLEARHTRDGEDAGDEPIAIVYNDADGVIRFEGADVDGDAPEIRLLPADQGFSLRIVQETDYSSNNMELSISGEKESVEKLSDQPTELLSLSQTELQGLLMRIIVAIKQMSGG